MNLQMQTEPNDDLDLDLDEDIANHRVDDPNVWGLRDVAAGRTPLSPETIYKTAGDSASGVMGLLMPSGEFRPADPSAVGRNYILQDGGADDGQIVPPGRTLPALPGHGVNAEWPTAFPAVTVWDSAMRSEPGVHIDEDTNLPVAYQEHTKGLLLGNYARKTANHRPAPREPEWGVKVMRIELKKNLQERHAA